MSILNKNKMKIQHLRNEIQNRLEHWQQPPTQCTWSCQTTRCRRADRPCPIYRCHTRTNINKTILMNQGCLTPTTSYSIVVIYVMKLTWISICFSKLFNVTIVWRLRNRESACLSRTIEVNNILEFYDRHLDPTQQNFCLFVRNKTKIKNF